MPWSSEWYTKMPPSLEEAARPDEEIARVIRFFQSLNDPAMDRWAVEALAAELMVPIVAVPTDPIKRAEEAAGLMSVALREAGRRRPWERAAITRAVIAPYVRELLDLAREWRDEGGGADWTGRDGRERDLPGRERPH